MASKNNIQAIYPLSPMQEGLLFHTVHAGESGAYGIQFSYVFQGELDSDAFFTAWRQVVDHHPVLRTAFVWKKRDTPLQVVRELVTLPTQVVDLRTAAPGEQEERVAAFLAEDRALGFDLGAAPLMRVTLIRLADTRTEFVWSFHHLLMDGWCRPLVFRDFFACYAALLRGTKAVLPTRRPYEDYIAWLQKQDLADCEAFWRKSLAGFRAPTPIPGDSPTAGESTPESYGEHRFAIPAAAVQELEAFARGHRLTLNTLVQGAWALLLSRCSGEEDLCFGATVSGRPSSLTGVDSMVGLFINTLPVRVAVDGNQTVGGWLGALQATNFALREYEYSPLASVLAWSDVPRGTPLFESLVVFENYPLDTATGQDTGGLVIESFRSFERTNYPLTVIVAPREELRFAISYDAARFDSESLARMAGHLETLLTGMAADSTRKLSAVPMLTAAERGQILVDWNATTIDYPSGRALHHWIEDQAERTPNAVALVFEGTPLTYRELDERANQLAHHLRAFGTGPETLIGICIERSLEMVVGLLGILKAGGAYVPIDPGYPAERIAYMLEDSGVRILLTQERLVETLGLSGLRSTPLNPPFRKGGGQIGFFQSSSGSKEGLGEGQEGLQGGSFLLPLLSEGGGWGEVGQVLCLDSDWPTISRQPITAPAVQTSDHNLAYMIYTSGSTGKPKGAMNTHAAIVNRLLWMQDEYQLTPADRVLQKTPFSFDVSVWEFFWPLMTGATLVITEPGGHQDSAYLARLIIDQRITTLHFVPSMLQVFIDDPDAANCTSLTRIICSGEALPVDLQNRCLALLPAGLHNLYGPTEAAVDVTYWPCKLDPDLNSVPIGKPIANTQIHILDKNLEPVPIGVAGELHIGGMNLARGYWRRPDLTAEKFIANPHSDTPGERLYKTGDLARYGADGSIEYLGRLDHQVKIRGFRIELGEIETALARHANIREAVVLAREDSPGDKRLVAYLVAGGDPPPSVKELRTMLAERLPEYMIPVAFVVLDALPLSPNGKVDRKALPAPDAGRPDLQRSYTAPGTRREKVLAEIWSQVLGVEQVGIHDDFFELGGDSLRSLRIVSRAAQAGLKVTTKQVFAHRTISVLAANATAAMEILADQGIVTGPVPLTPVQEWFLETATRQPNFYNTGDLMVMRGALDADLMREAFRHLVNHHDTLRLRITRREDGFSQAIAAPDNDLPFLVLDFSAVPEAEIQGAIMQGTWDQSDVFDLAQGPVVKLVFFTGARTHLWLVYHHLAVDGVSARILREDLILAYEQLSAGLPVRLPAKTTSFKQWADRLAEHAKSTELLDESAYWLDQPWPRVTPIPLDFPENKGQNIRDSYQYIAEYLTIEETEFFLDAIARHGLTVSDVLLTVLGRAFSRWTCRDTLLCDVTRHGREDLFGDTDLSRTVGWLVTQAPLIVELGCDPLDKDLELVKRRVDGIPNNGIGYGLLRYMSPDSALRAKFAALPRAEVLFKYDGHIGMAAQTHPLLEYSFWRFAAGGDDVEAYLVNCQFNVMVDRLMLNWGYSQKLHRPETIQRVMADYLEILRSLITMWRAA